MGDFAEDTHVVGSNGTYTATLSRDWEIWGPNGGYLAAIALRAAGTETPLRRPATLACQFLSVAEFGPVDLTVRVLRAAKRAAAVGVSMSQNGRAIVEALAWAVDADSKGLEHNVTRMPSVPAPGALQSYEELQLEGYPWFPFWQNVETREIGRPLDQNEPGEPVWQAWMRFRPAATFDDPFVDAARAVVLLDTMSWPAAARAHAFPRPYLAPSLDVSVQFHQRAAGSEWLLCDTRAPIANGGLIGSQAQVWSQDGQLIASGGSQLLCRPNPMYTG